MGSISIKKLKLPYLLLAWLIAMAVIASLAAISGLTWHHRKNTQSVQDWIRHLKRLSEVERFANEVNAPGNDIFQSKEVLKEEKRLEGAIRNYQASYQQYLGELKKTGLTKDSPILQGALKIDASVDAMVKETQLVFGYFSKNRQDLAASRMAVMDQKFSDLLKATDSARLCIFGFYEAHLADEAILENNLEKNAYGVSMVVLFLLFGIIFYSLKVVQFVKAAEDLVSKSREFLESLLNHSPSLIYSKCPEGKYLLANTRFEEVMRLDRKSILGKVDHELFAKDVADRAREEDRQVLKKKAAQSFDISTPVPGGEIKNYQSVKFPIFNQKGEVIAVGGVSTDVTSQRRAENTLRQLHSAVDQSAIVAIADQGGKITFANENFCVISGYARDEIIGKTHKIINSGYHDRDFFSSMWKTISSGNVWKGEVKNKSKDGKFYWVDTTITPMRDPDTRAMHYVAIRYDITAKKEAESALEQSKEMALSAVRVKSEFLANMSHEIRTPMNGVIGICNFLLSEENDSGKKEKLKIIHSCGNTLLNLINDVLDFSKLELSKVELESDPFNLSQNILDILELLGDRAKEKGLKLSYRADDNVPAWILGDATRVSQVLMNLISNAIKFTDCGSVEISSRVLSQQIGRPEIHFSVKDTGPGVAENLQDKLFRPFSQVDASTVRKFGGSGLGLAICKGLCEKMDGRIWMESSLGSGSVFSFSLPFVAAEPKSEIESSEPFIHFDSGMAVRLPLQILIAEDNRINQMVVTGILERLGYRTDVAANGVEALRALKIKHYDLIFMDCHMPELDGYQATRKIRTEHGPEFKQPKIVAVTAGAGPEDVDRCYASGMDDFIGKPIQPKDILRVLKKHYDVPQTGTEPASIPMADATPPSAREFDRDSLLKNFLGMEDVMADTIEDFLQTWPVYLGKVQQSIERQDVEALVISAHSIKGALSNFFAEPAKQAAWELEQFASKRNWESLEKSYQILKNELECLARALADLRSGKKAA